MADPDKRWRDVEPTKPTVDLQHLPKKSKETTIKYREAQIAAVFDYKQVWHLAVNPAREATSTASASSS